MSAQKVLGTDRPVETRIQRDVGIKEATIIEVEGCYSDLERVDPSTYCPNGLCVETSSLTSTGDGMGKLTIRCLAYDENGAASLSPVRTTFRVEMLEVVYDLAGHPHLAAARDIITKWLATDESVRVEGDSFYYSDDDESVVEIDNEFALKFCNAYMAGIKTYNRYYPVIEKISIWKNPPGLNRGSGTSFTGGTPTFSGDVGKFSAPPISLNGYADSNFFKSKDSWVEDANKTWTRTEQWTYTPDGSSGTHAWIYSSNS